MEDEALTQKSMGCAMAVHRALGPGFLESVYQKALAHELQATGLEVVCECPIRVVYAGVELGLLLNFGADSLQFKRKTRTYRPKASAHPRSHEGIPAARNANPDESC